MQIKIKHILLLLLIHLFSKKLIVAKNNTSLIKNNKLTPDHWTLIINNLISLLNKKTFLIGNKTFLVGNKTFVIGNKTFLIGNRIYLIKNESLTVPINKTTNKPPLKKYKNIIISNYKKCSEIGEQIITKEGGNGFDAAIGVMLCEGVAKPQDMGIGGGFLGLIKNENSTFIINSRERGPKRINQKLFKYKDSSKRFGKTIGVPSAIKGYGYLHKKYGKTNWKNIIKYIEKMCNDGFEVVVGDILNKQQYEYLEESHREIFINNKTNLPYANGEIWKRPDLAKTMNILKNKGADYFYKGKMMRQFKEEINKNGGIIVDSDFKFNPIIMEPLEEYFQFNENQYKIITTPLPGGGPTLVFVLRIMELFLKEFPLSTKERKLYVLIEAIKFSFSYRTQFGDPNFTNMTDILNEMKNPLIHQNILTTILECNTTINNPEYYHQKYDLTTDHGTANIIVKTNKELIVLTSTINLRFGSYVISDSGFIYNNQMTDFSIPNRKDSNNLPPSINNFPEGNKFPISSISTTIIQKYNNNTNNYEDFLALGAAGGTKIITSIAQVLLNIIDENKNIITSITAPRFHHQLYPSTISVETDFLKKYNKTLNKYNYEIEYPLMTGDYSAVTGIQIKNNKFLIGTYDPRRPGGIAKF